MALPAQVRMVEVGPRDGLQNEATAVPAAVKIGLIDRLTLAGLPVIEAGSFVSPKWVPQMADTAAVLAGIERRPGVSYPVLVPNLKGLEAALLAGVEEIAIFAAATEAFSRRNINCSIAESLERFAPICRRALDEGIKVRGYVSVVLGCPYQGEVQPAAVSEVALRLHDMGCYEISLGDTIGTGTAGKTQRMFEVVAQRVPLHQLAGHFHDTYGQALANIYASLEMGIATFDSSISGLGGCPYAPGATGNVASEDVLYLLDGLGIRTSVDIDQLLAAGSFICDHLQRPPASRAARALSAQRARSRQSEAA